ncbi:S8 family serine peptidase [Dyella sp. A6]|uniref:S8 family serine peptidase n=1 Tax=Dyella aluminiiresistens TaxID=3069105 RepID=UPI002E7A8226|nr:S8 family serine peptidase [Dyella sp. A6]
MSTTRSLHICLLASALLMAMPFAHAATTSTPALAAKVNLRTLTNSQQYDRFIVTYRKGSTESTSGAAVAQNIRAAVSRAGFGMATRSSTGAAVPGMTVSYMRKLAMGAQLVRTSRKLNASEAATLMGQIAADPAVAHVEADVMMHLVRDISSNTVVAPSDLFTGAPNDTYYSYQWHFNNATGGADVANAWPVADGAGIIVAVIDTGITAHPDIDESLADAGYDFITDAAISGRTTNGRVAGGWDTGDWTTADECASGSPAKNSSWHGTHVSGTIAELTNNSTGMAGIAHSAKVLPVRALGHCGGYTSDIADAIEWASGGTVSGVPDNTNPAQVINMSLGGSGTCSASDVTGTAIADAIARGTTVVVAAGNSDVDASTFTPASCPGVITVASNGITGKRAFYSNYGNDVTLSAPGGGVYANDASSGTQVQDGFVWSAINSGTTTPVNATYGGMAGTSQAAPHVTGTVAMILGAEKAAGMPLSTPAEIKDILVNSARAFPVTEDQPIGAGILDAAAAVNLAINGGSGGGVDPSAITLTEGTVLSDQSGSAGTSQLYALTVPAGATRLSLRSFGGTGNVTMYVKAGTVPAADGSDADITSARPGNTETAVIATPTATTYYIRIVGVSNYAGLRLLGTYSL